MARKTINVEDILGMVNKGLNVQDSVLRLENRDGTPMTPEQAFRMGMANVLESVLHRTDNYKGYVHNGLVIDGKDVTVPDETRRTYR